MARAFTPLERLEGFCRVADAASDRRAITEGTLAADVTYSVTSGGPEVVTADHGDEEDFRSLTLDIRKFVLQEGAANFNATANLLYQRLTDDELREASVKNRALWDRAMQGDGVLHDENRQPIRADRMFDVVTYGGMFHDNADRVAEWEGLDELYQQMYRAEVTPSSLDAYKWLERRPTSYGKHSMRARSTSPDRASSVVGSFARRRTVERYGPTLTP